MTFDEDSRRLSVMLVREIPERENIKTPSARVSKRYIV